MMDGRTISRVVCLDNPAISLLQMLLREGDRAELLKIVASRNKMIPCLPQ